MKVSTILCLCTLLTLTTLATSKLLTVQIISRHGTRAPNPVVTQLCPNNLKNIHSYENMRISLAGLTGRGMQELYDLGVYTRQMYIETGFPGFLTTYFNNVEMYFRAVGEDRTIQSAVAMSQGMFPAGTSPKNYLKDIPAPVPIYTLPDEEDNLLETRKGACKHKLAADVKIWDETVGAKLIKDNQKLIDKMSKLCGVDMNQAIIGSGDNLGDAIKDITDMWTFDRIEQFPEQQLSADELLEFRTLAVQQLLGRILGTEEQITYLNGELPRTMQTNFKNAIDHRGLKMYAYHGHREMMYALADFLGIEFDITFPALPKGAIPPGTTMFFELHVQEDINAGTSPDQNGQSKDHALKHGTHFVRTYVWHPCHDNPLHEPLTVKHIDCPATQVKLDCSSMDCPFDEFNAIIDKRVNATTEWNDICNFHPAPIVRADKLAIQSNTQSITELHNYISGFAITCAVLFVIAISLSTYVMCVRGKLAGAAIVDRGVYEQIP